MITQRFLTSVCALLSLLTVWSEAHADSKSKQDKLVILSPHRKSIQDEFIPRFRDAYKKKYGNDVEVEWLDQGGTSDDLRFIKAKIAQDPKKPGVDIFWGGGTATFLELTEAGILAPYQLSKELKAQIPETAAGVSMVDSKGRWYASAMSSFGLFFNRVYIKALKIDEPKTWADLANPRYRNLVTLADPRRSGTASTMNTIILQGLGWDQGWNLLIEMAGNNRAFTHSSSDPIKNIVSGDAAASTAIDFYALAKVAEVGDTKLGFVMPENLTVLDPDPIGIIKNAANRTTAERFVEYVLTPEAQTLLVLKKGDEGGPNLSTLGRIAVNKEVYPATEGRRLNPFNPFTAKTMMKVDEAKAAKMRRTFDDLLGAVLIDTHNELKDAWAVVSKLPADSAERKEFGQAPISEDEILKLSEKWEDNVLRNQKINEWQSQSRAKYLRLAGKKS